MQGFVLFLETRFVPIAAKIGGQRHLVAIRDAFAGLMPLILVGAFAVLLNNVFFVPWSLLAYEGLLGADHPFIVWAFEHVAPLFSLMESGTLAILSLGLTFSLGYNRALVEDNDPLPTGLINVAVFIMLGALVREQEVFSWVGNYLASQGIFFSLLVGLLAPEVYFAVVRKNWVIKLPEQVPPAVMRGFLAVIPGFITIFVFAVVAYIFNVIIGVNLFNWFETNIAQALMIFAQSIWSVMAISLLICLFWFFGLHGANIMEAIMGPLYTPALLQNVDLYQRGITAVGTGAEEMSVWVRSSWDAYVFMGGSGATLPLIVAILLFSKLVEHRQVAKLGVAPGIFMINEPITFGIPIVLNPIFFIPFVIVQPILAAVAYILTAVGFAAPIVNYIPWVTPPIISALLATNGNLGAGFTALLNLGIAFIIYLPFVIVANKHQEKVEEKAKELTS